MDTVNRQTVYVLMLEHEMQVLQHCVGVYTTFEKLIEAQNSIKIETTLYEAYFEYTDEYPPAKNEFAIIETSILDDRTIVLKVTNLPGYYDGPTQMAFIDPDLDYVAAYIDCVAESEEGIRAFMNDEPSIYDQFADKQFPDCKFELSVHEESTEDFDLGDETMNELRDLLKD